jgi:hypothetical protein
MPRAAKRALERPTEVKAAVDPARTARRAATELMVIFIVQLSNCGWPFMLSAIILRSKMFRCAAGRGATSLEVTCVRVRLIGDSLLPIP